MHFCVPEQQQLVHIAARPTDVLKTVSHHNPEQVIVSDTIPRKAFKPEQTKIFRSSGDLALLQSRRGKLSYTNFKFYFIAVDQLEQSGIRTCMMKAVEAAAKRCQQLGA